MRFNLGREKVFSIKEYFIRVSKRDLKFEEFWALRDISFHLDKGEILGVVGVNGSGKSTLLKLIAGVLLPTLGKVQVNGSIAPMIELGAGFDYEMTGSENVYLNGAVMGLSKEFLKSKYNEIVEFSELADFMNVPVKNFSSGMVARLAFSISTMVKPDILIIDEILSVGDAPFQRKSEQRMKKLIQEGTTVVFVSHSIAAVQEICTKGLWLDKGRMMAFGDAEKVCNEYKLFCDQKA
jgi:ABC-type polysaccharide/polyol phosphate transport system ATPase subunit